MKFARNFIGSRFSNSLFLDAAHRHILNGSSRLKNPIVNMSASGSETATKSTTEGNLLRSEKSPYLLQHKDNPVHW